MSLRPRPPVLGGISRSGQRMAPGGRRWSESPVPRPGLQRPRQVGPTCLRYIYPDAVVTFVGSYSTTGADPYVNDSGTVTLADGGVISGRVCWSLPATTLPSGMLAWRVQLAGQWVDGTGSSYGQVVARLYSDYGGGGESLWSYGVSDMDGGDTFTASDLTVRQEVSTYSETIRSELATGTLQLAVHSAQAAGTVYSFRIDEVCLIADYCTAT